MEETGESYLFETERFVVRPYTVADRDNFFALSGNEQVMQYIRAVQTREESDKFLDEIINFSMENPLMGRWAVDEKTSGNFVGSFAIIPIAGEEEKIQLGYSLLPDQWGRGIATELTFAGLRYFATNFRDPVVYGITEEPNTASQNVLLKAGFEEFGTKMEGEKTLIVFMKRLRED